MLKDQKINDAYYFVLIIMLTEEKMCISSLMSFPLIKKRDRILLKQKNQEQLEELITWIAALQTKIKRFLGACSAVSIKQCEKCPNFPIACGFAFVYLRVFPHRKLEWALKVGISSSVLRPLAQSAPFAIITDNINRRDSTLVASLSQIAGYQKAW